MAFQVRHHGDPCVISVINLRASVGVIVPPIACSAIITISPSHSASVGVWMWAVGLGGSCADESVYVVAVRVLDESVE